MNHSIIYPIVVCKCSFALFSFDNFTRHTLFIECIMQACISIPSLGPKGWRASVCSNGAQGTHSNQRIYIYRDSVLSFCGGGVAGSSQVLIILKTMISYFFHSLILRPEFLLSDLDLYVETFWSINLIYRRGYFVYHNWRRT